MEQRHRVSSLCSVEADAQQGEDMQSTLNTLTAHLAEVARRSFGTYLPWSPLTGIGPATEFAAWHPAFTIDAENDPRLDA
jgi:hypothetical protein